MATTRPTRMLRGRLCIDAALPTTLQQRLRVALALIGVLCAGCNVPLDGDQDGDGYSVRSDCDDADATVFPGATEACNGQDDNCDGEIDELEADGAPPQGATLWYVDADGDGYGDETFAPMLACAPPPGYATDPGASTDGTGRFDCDDMDSDIHPGALELCDGIDQDCDLEVDEGVGSWWYPDQDGDGYGDTGAGVQACAAPAGHIPDGSDCDDGSAAVHPGATETCDGRDSNCDGSATAAAPRYADHDHDGFGSESDTVCWDTDGYVEARGDCDDADPALHPGAVDAASDGIDQDCGGTDDRDPHVGLSEDSLDSLEQALRLADDGNTVWVGPGTYLEHDLSFDGKAIWLASTHLASRTTIDARQKGRHFLFVGLEGPESVLDGFTLTGGKAYGNSGGAVLITGGANPTLTLCTFLENEAKVFVIPNQAVAVGGYGGAVHIEAAGATITACTFTGNTSVGGSSWGDLTEISSGGAGGAISVIKGALTLRDSSILENFAVPSPRSGGAGISVMGSSAVISHCLIRGNRTVDEEGGDAPGLGGGVYFSTSSGSVDHCIIDLNSTYQYIYTEGTYGWGGGVALADSSPTLDHTLIVGNRAAFGGGVYLKGVTSQPVISNSIIAYQDGFNLFNEPTAPGAPVMRYNDLYTPAGANHNLESLDGSNLSLEPGFVIFGETGADDDYHLAPGSPLVNAGEPAASNPDGSRADIGPYGGDTPWFYSWVDADHDGMYDPWETLHGLSPTRDDSGQDPDGDGAGNLEEQSLHTDPRNPDGDGDGATDGEELEAGSDPHNRWSQPGQGLMTLNVPGDFGTLQAAIDAITSEGVIAVGPGAWQENLRVDHRRVTLYGREGAAATELRGSSTALDASQSTVRLRDLTIGPAPGDTVTTGLHFSYSDVELEGLVSQDSLYSSPSYSSSGGIWYGFGASMQYSTGLISSCIFQRNGNGGLYLEGSSPSVLSSSFLDSQGAGVAMLRSNPRIDRCRIDGNGIQNYGGLYVYDSSPRVSLSSISDNEGPTAGVWIYGRSVPLLENCRIERNTGGGVLIAYASPRISHCLIRDNTTTTGGGGITSYGSSALIEHTLILDNRTTYDGGGALLQASTDTLSHCVISGNRANGPGAGVHVDSASSGKVPSIDHSILAYHAGYNLYVADGTVKVQWSDLYSTGQNHNLSALDATNQTVEPGFLSYDSSGQPADFHLALASKLVDAGDGSSLDPDGSRADVGLYGGEDGDGQDLDGDGLPAWFWPGVLDDAPAGVDPAQYDADDLETAGP